MAKVDIRTLDQSVVNRFGARFLGFTIQRADSGNAEGAVAVRVDYSSIAGAFGGSFATRLRLTRYPQCALTSPDKPECRLGTPVASTIDPARGQLTAVIVAAPAAPASDRAAAPAPPTVYAVEATPTSDGGTYTATPLKASDAWVVGEQSGSFSYSYPLPAVPSVGGTSPDLGLSYDSGSIDGLTAAENNQSSPSGLGWSIGTGFIERRFTPCTDKSLTGNMCWHGGESILNLNGRSSGLTKIWTNATGEVDLYRAQEDEGWRIEKIYAGAGNDNGDHIGAYWKITSNDGTQYYFGREQLTWSIESSDSTLNLPVYSTKAGDPCWDSPNHVCEMAWRWNLTFVVDPMGNLQTFKWDKARYSYEPTSGGGVRHYDGAAYLTSVRYGNTIRNAATTKPPQRINLDYTWRCTYDGCPEPTTSDTANYPDIPFDQWCKGDASSCGSGPTSPVFFYLKRLTSVTSNVYRNGEYAPVERVDLGYTFPTFDGKSWTALMWLNTIKKTGYTPSGETVSLPAVSFKAEWLRNRLKKGPTGTYQEKPRISDIYHEFGGHAHVTYGQPNPCDSQTLDGNEDKQTTNCYPTKGDDGSLTWFRRNLVTQLDRVDRYGAPTHTTSYEYDSESGAAWHSDNSIVTKSDKQTWADYRGYRKMTIREGTPGGKVTVTKKRFFQGMHGDHLKDGSTRSVELETTESTDAATSRLKYTDHYYLKGRPLEEHLERGDGLEVSATQHEYSAYVVHKGPAGPWDLYQHGVVQVNETLTRQMTTVGDSERALKHVTRKRYENLYNLLVSVQDDGDPVSKTGPSCTYTSYAQNPDLHIVDTESSVVTAAGTCPTDGTAPYRDLIERTDTYYDEHFASLEARPSVGLATKVVKWASAAGTADPSTAISASKYDGYGRVIATIAPDNIVAGATSFDTAGPATTTTFTPAEGAVTGIATTGPGGHVATQVMDPGRAHPVATTDANGRTTKLSYDGLGRLTGVRFPGEDFDAKTFSYTLSETAPSVVVTSEYPAKDASPVRTWEFYDSLARKYQTQKATADGSVYTTGTRFDDRGNAAVEVAALAGAGNPGTVYGQWYDKDFTATLPSQTVTEYDEANREISATLISSGKTKWVTKTSHDGASATTTPPSNSGASQPDLASTTLTTDSGDHIVTRVQGGRTTKYGYDLSGNLVKSVSPAGVESSYTYDWLGRRTASTDPDAGTTTTEYYPSGEVKRSRDAKGDELYTALDVMSRPVATYAGRSAEGALLSKTVYDGIPLGATAPLKGTVTSETSYVGSTPGTLGTAYTETFGYDSRYHVTRQARTIPAVLGSALAGTYTTTVTFDGLGRETSTSYPAAGGLPSEKVTTGWSGEYPATLSSPLATYVSETRYTGIGQVASRTLGRSGATGSVKRAYTWDLATEKLLTQAAASPSTSGTANLQSDTYTYSPTGDVTKINDALVKQQQCFSYDSLDRLTRALTAASGEATGNGCAADSTGPLPYQEAYDHSDDANLTAITRNGTKTSFGYGTSGSLTGGPHAPTTAVTGTSTTTLSYDPAGQLATKIAAGETTSYGWDSEDRLVSISAGKSSARFAYGPDDNRWVRVTNSETVVYLEGQELHLAAGASKATAVRHYALAKHPVGVRKSTAGGSGDGALIWVLSDRQDSASVAVNASTGEASRERYLPYGGNRNQAAGATWTMPSDRGWLGQIQDRDTGLDFLNARYYDPLLVHFISADLVDLKDTPESANAYGYAAGNPIGFYDPNGLWPSFVDRAASAVSGSASSAASWVADHKDVIVETAVTVGVGAAIVATGGAGAVVVAAVVAGAAGGAAGYGTRVAEGKETLSASGLAMAVAEGAVTNATPGGKAAKIAAVAGKKLVTSAGRKSAVDAVRAGARTVKATAGKAKASASKAPTAAKSKPTQPHAGGEKAPSCPSTAKPHSFAPDVPVLMASGAAVPIAEIKVGDSVKAIDPVTGVALAEPVTALHINYDSGLIQVTVETPAGGTVLHTTQHHPFYDATVGDWVDAGVLVPGHQLRTDTGATVTVRSVEAEPGSALRRDLTVNDLHTYYVLAGTTPVLVHNCGPGRDLIDGDAQYHIITGNRTGGGHKWPGQPGKTVFPPSWGTDKILDGVADVATSPSSRWTWQTGARGSMYTRAGDPSRVKIEGVHDGVNIRVIFEPANDRIVTAFPIG